MERGTAKDSKSTSLLTSLTIDELSGTNFSVTEQKAEGLSKEESKRLRRKIDLHLIPLMTLVYLIQFTDKSTLNFSAILGLIKSTHLTAEQYNWLGTIFYISFLVFQFPQNLALQRYPIGIWVGCNCFVWAVALGAQAACKNFAQLMICRFILGACEGCVIPGFMIVTAMFYTHKEQGVRMGYWFLMSGFSQISSGFVSYVILGINHNPKIMPWQFYFILNALITLIVAVMIVLAIPASPMTAWFLTEEEREKAVLRVKINETKVEDKTFRKHQAKEALLDRKTWIWFLFCVLVAIPSSLSNQISIIVVTFGFTVKQTTLLTCGFGAVSMLSMLIGVKLIDNVKNSRGWMGALWYVLSTIGAILIITLPWNNQNGLLLGIYLATLSATPFVVVLGWIVSATAGHTKRVIVQAIVLTGYCLGNIIGPQMWRAAYKPRNRVPWGIIIGCQVICAGIMLGMRTMLKTENQRRSKLPNPEDLDFNELDLTDIENPRFRYVY